jgi:hypothetical protein
MAAYQVTHETPTGTVLPIINLTGGASNQLFLDTVSISSDEVAPAEQITKYRIQRTTDAGTGGTALTETKRNPLTSAPVGAAVGGTFSAAPAIGDILWAESVHQKIPFVLQFYPGNELITAATAANGIELASIAASAAYDCVATLGWKE